MTRKPDDKTPARTAARSSGLVVGGRGGPEDELLESGQEEVFSRSEVESGRIEHQARAGGSSDHDADERKRPD
ncbi:MAG: hypothetical protein ACK4JY_09395 [Brevundimonas sp.]|uniref:hypothetical protein n=1 Tax=Brevundimonas sp. TaxID=1871086 RepID=UPI003919B3F8